MYQKLFQSGDLIEIYTYEREPVPSRLRKRVVTRQEASYQHARLRRTDNLNQAKQSFRRLVRANLPRGCPSLLTLTMLDILDYSSAVECFTSFGQRLRRLYGQDLAWVAVAEFQRRGALHFHSLVWGIPDVDIYGEKNTRRIQNLWRYGYVDIFKTDGSPKLVSYLSKYMSKAMSDPRLSGKRAYCGSGNLMRPMQTSSPAQIDFIYRDLELSTTPTLQDRSYGTMWLGRANYKSYSTNQYGQESSRVGSQSS